MSVERFREISFDSVRVSANGCWLHFDIEGGSYEIIESLVDSSIELTSYWKPLKQLSKHTEIIAIEQIIRQKWRGISHSIQPAPWLLLPFDPFESKFLFFFLIFEIAFYLILRGFASWPIWEYHSVALYCLKISTWSPLFGFFFEWMELAATQTSPSSFPSSQYIWPCWQVICWVSWSSGTCPIVRSWLVAAVFFVPSLRIHCLYSEFHAPQSF